MSTLNNEFHEEVAAIALKAARAFGFALGGGYAFVAYGLVDRVTEDVDLFSDEEGAVPLAADAVCAAMVDAGLGVHRDDGINELADVFEDFALDMTELYVSRGDQGVRVSLARLDRSQGPAQLDIGPVLAVEDVLGSKVAAMAGRGEVRDYIDVAAALGRYSRRDLLAFAYRLDPGLTDEDYADAARRLDRLSDRLFVGYGLDAEDVGQLRERFADWPRGA